MIKDRFYFPHDYNARNDEKTMALIIETGAAGYGIYWAIVEILHEKESHSIDLTNIFLKSFAKQMSTTVEHVLECVNKALDNELFKKDGNILTCDRVNENILIRTNLSSARSKAGKASAAKRQGNSTSVQHLSTKERKVKESKEKETIINRVSEELKNSAQMIEAVCMKNTINRDKCKELLEIFITDQKATDGLYRPIPEIKSHFLNWVPKYLVSAKVETKPLRQVTPIPSKAD